MRILGYVVVVLAAAGVWYYASSSYHPVSHDPNDRSTIEYWMAHGDDRTTMVAYCSRHQEEQRVGDCARALAAQRKLEGTAQAGQAGNSGTDQNTSAAADQLEAQKASNEMP
jgi:hypothetical protein